MKIKRLIAVLLLSYECLSVNTCALTVPSVGDRITFNDFVRVEGGTFMMGCQEGRDTDCEEGEKPTHEVTLSTFYIGKYEVTQAQWRVVMDSAPPGLDQPGCDKCPVERVGWNEIEQFLQKLNEQTGLDYRLPTEAEWEYAARGGHKSRGYLYSGSDDISEVAWDFENSLEGYIPGNYTRTHPVGGKKSNELGLFDMSGNVHEWCSSSYDDYPNSPRNNPQGNESSVFRVYRGGSWTNGPKYCRTTWRARFAKQLRFNSIGFRLALSTQ